MSEIPDLLRPAVNQILVADDLIGRYVAAARSLSHAIEPEDVVARANEYYPHIWDSLAQARDMLAVQGRDMTDFDAIRAAAGGDEHSGGLIDREDPEVDIAASVLRLGLVMTQASTYSLNTRGVAIAARGLEALRAALPEVDWDTLAREQEQAGRMLGGSPVKWIVLGLVLLALIVLVYYLRCGGR